MRVFIVHAHPERQSFTTALASLAADELQRHGHAVAMSDLYAMRFNPVASAADFSNRHNPDYLVYALEQRHGLEKGGLADDIRTELEKLIAADLVIFNFPLYWFSVPAILKGWIDRVLISGLCYGGKRFYDQGGLKGKKALVTLTLGGRDHMFGDDAIHGRIEDMLRPLLRGTLAYVGMDVLPPFIAWHVPYVSDAVRKTYLDDYRAMLGSLETLAPLAFPRLDDFDEKLYPRRKA